MSYYLSINQDSTFWIGEKCGCIMLNKKSNMKLINLKPISFKSKRNKIFLDLNEPGKKQKFDNYVEYNLCYKIPSKSLKNNEIHDITEILENITKKNEKTSFNPFKSFSKEKHDVNSLYVSYVKEYNYDKGYHLVLDAETLLTTHYLYNIGVKSSNVVVPNPNIANFVTDRYTKDVNLWDGMFHDFIDIHSNNGKCTFNLSSIFLDYCCTFDGNKDCSPKLDINALLDTDILKNNCIIGFTFCTRNSSTKNVPEHVNKLLEEKCKKVKKLVEKKYYSMLFLLYELRF